MKVLLALISLCWSVAALGGAGVVAQSAATAPASQTADAEPKPEKNTADVFLLGGQSNMQGIGKIADLPEGTAKEVPEAMFWNGKEFEPLVLGKTKTSTRAGEFGPEIGFALEMAKTQPGKTFYLIKYAASGMPLHHGWNGNKWVGGPPQPKRRNFYPGERPDDPNAGTLYRDMLAKFRAGVEHLKQAGKKPVIRGFLWMQGEQDSKHVESATVYATSLARLRKRLAEDMQTSPELPLVFGQALPHSPPLERFTHRDELRQQMAAADRDSGKPEAIKQAKMVSTDGFELLPDTVHYNASGQLRLGSGMARALNALAPRAPKEKPAGAAKPARRPALQTNRPASAKSISFNRDIRPFLSGTCFQCHGPDANTREADLRLDLPESALADREGAAAIVPGKPDASQAMRRLLSDDPDEQMPPPGSGLKLTAAQKDAFRRWIEQGAEYQSHWAFQPVTRPAVPEVLGAQHPIDAFIQSRLADAGLRPSAAATAETQIRRVTLDMTGLPPTLTELDAFLSDVQECGLDAAYERVVDRLLRSPRYGERMAWPWMEAARYADTDGYQNDGPREMWRWRDWVIEAFTSGMPFDQFTIEQLAGDLLPEPSEAQLIATAFNRNNRYNSEEGIPIDEFLLENAVDRVDTTATVWMGLTAGCARCHDHKFDPLTQKEYYQLIDYFNDVAESGRAVKFGNSEPWIKTPVAEQKAQLAELDDRVRLAEQRLEEADARLARGQSAWEEKGLATFEPVLAHGLDAHFSFDAPDDRVKPLKDAAPALVAGVQGSAISVDPSHTVEIGKIQGLIGNGRFSIAFWLNPHEPESNGPVLSNEAPSSGRNGILVEMVDGRLRWNINTRWISGVSTVETKQQFRPDQWVHVALTNDGTQRAAGMLVYVDGRLQDVNVIRNTNSNASKRNLGDTLKLGFSKHVGSWRGQIDELRFATRRTLSPEEIELLAVPETLPQIAAIEPHQRTTQQARLMRIAYLEQGAPKKEAQLWNDWNDAVEARTAYWDSLPTTMIMRDLAQPRPSYVRVRGVYDAQGEKVQPGVPAVLPPLPADEHNSRLALARWLVSREHPLTARVTVNRFWQMFFGTGLVKTTEDFGSQGELPSHPELLDWLAAEFMDSGWDVKKFLKTIVTSHTYRQSSLVTPAMTQIDPENRLLARAPRLRLPGNVLRDQALFVSGLLVEKQGGPSVFPYQPARLWEEASNAKYTVGKGADLYRRSLYTYWKRTLAPPAMAVLDTADRESCAVRPKLTNTPLQALTLMNEVTFFEAARKLAEKILACDGSSDTQRIDFAFRTVTSRHPSPEETAILVEAWNKYRRETAAAPQQAAAILKVGQSPANEKFSAVDLAAATALANVLLNLEEVTTRE